MTRDSYAKAIYRGQPEEAERLFDELVMDEMLGSKLGFALKLTCTCAAWLDWRQEALDTRT